MLGPSGFAHGKPKTHDLPRPLRKLNTLSRQLFLGSERNFLPWWYSCPDVSLRREAVLLSTNVMAPAALFPSENTSILLIEFFTLEISFDERREKSRWTWKKIQIPILYKKVEYRNLCSTFFYKPKLYLLICSKFSFTWSAVGGLTTCLCSRRCCLPSEALTVLDSATRGGRGSQRESTLALTHCQLLWIGPHCIRSPRA